MAQLWEFLRGAFNRIAQLVARSGPGASTLRIWLHRLRGVQIGEGCWIGYDCILETSRPELISLGRHVAISMRVTMIAHFHETAGISIEDDVFIGPGAIILPNVVIGRGSVIAAGSVVATSVPPQTMVQGNPGRVVARCTVPLTMGTPLARFRGGLRPVGANATHSSMEPSPAARSKTSYPPAKVEQAVLVPKDESPWQARSVRQAASENARS